METIYTRQNGRAALCSIESPHKYFNQGVEILGHRVRLSSSEPAHTRRLAQTQSAHGRTRAEMAVIQGGADDGARGRQTHLRSVFARSNQRVPNQAKTN